MEWLHSSKERSLLFVKALDLGFQRLYPGFVGLYLILEASQSLKHVGDVDVPGAVPDLQYIVTACAHIEHCGKRAARGGHFLYLRENEVANSLCQNKELARTCLRDESEDSLGN